MPGSSRPFSRISQEVLVTNSWHRYCLDQYTQTDGTQGEYYYIDMPGACGVIPLFEDGRTALLQVDRYVLGQRLWEFPIGGMKDGDEPADVAARELREEAGLLANRWDELGKFAPYKGVSNEITRFFLARDLTWTEQELEASEGISVHPMPLAQARQRLLDQDLPDGQSITGLVLLDRFLARED